jgi:hypothetical protein
MGVTSCAADVNVTCAPAFCFEVEQLFAFIQRFRLPYLMRFNEIVISVAHHVTQVYNCPLCLGVLWLAQIVGFLQQQNASIFHVPGSNIFTVTRMKYGADKVLNS